MVALGQSVVYSISSVFIIIKCKVDKEAPNILVPGSLA